MARGERLGMSPLIATVLLMAFAVALGGMIMNWSIDISTNGECELLHEHITVHQFCTSEGNIILRMQSDSESPALQGVKLNILSEDIENVVNVKNAELKPSARLELGIPFPVVGEATVELIGIVGPKGEPFVCYDNPIERVEPIYPCN